MRRIVLIIFWLGPAAMVLFAQIIPKNAIKLDILALQQNRLQISMDGWRQRHGGFAFQFTYERFNDARSVPNAGLDEVNYFGRERLDTVFRGAQEVLATSGWYYLDGQKALGMVSANLPKDVFLATLFYRITLDRPGRPWILNLKPGIFGSFHRYFTVQNSLNRYDLVKTSYIDSTNPGSPYAVQQTTEQWKEQRKTRAAHSWQAGAAFQVTIGRQLGRFLVIEAGLEGRAGFGAAPYSDPSPPKILRSLNVQPVLNLGWTF